MDHWIPYLEALKPKKIRAMITRSPERPTNKGTTAKKPRAPHQVESPFPLPLPHSHQEDNEARTTPAIFLACALQSGELMKIKDDDPKNNTKGDSRGAILCSCKDPTKRDPDRTATFQEFKKRQKIKPTQMIVTLNGHYMIVLSFVFLFLCCLWEFLTAEIVCYCQH